MVPSMADAESRREPGPAAAAGESRAETDVRPARTLGRGLAELSPLFLSHRRVDVPVVTKPLAPVSPAVPLAPASPAASLEPAAPAAPAAPATPAPALSERNTARRRSGTLLLRPQPSKVTPNAAQSHENTDTQDFYPIPYTPPLQPYERVLVVQTNVPVTALIAAGFHVQTSDPGGSVRADVMVSQDGRPRAIRPVVFNVSDRSNMR